MNLIELRAITRAGNSSHVSVFINKKDVGILYLKDNEIDIFLRALSQGAGQADIQLETDLDFQNSEGEYEEND
jgi:hypothetical protein